jgi:hypothetical protein
VNLTTHLHLVPRSKNEWSYTSTPQYAFMAWCSVKRKAQGQLYLTLCTRTVCKVRGLTLLLRVGTLWRCVDSLLFEVPPLASDALLTTLHPLLENVLQTVNHFEISCLGAPFSWLEKPRKCRGRDLNWILCSAWIKWIGRTPLEHLPYRCHEDVLGDWRYSSTHS